MPEPIVLLPSVIVNAAFGFKFLRMAQAGYNLITTCPDYRV
jgi:hypothetical protein